MLLLALAAFGAAIAAATAMRLEGTLVVFTAALLIRTHLHVASWLSVYRRAQVCCIL